MVADDKRADTMSNWVIESLQETVSKIKKKERGFFPTPNVLSDDQEN